MAPSSIIAWLKSPGRFGSNRLLALSRNQVLGMVVWSSPKRRSRTRSTFPSTTAVGSPWAMLAMAAEV